MTKEELELEKKPVDKVDYDSLKESRIRLYKKAAKLFFQHLPKDYNTFLNEQAEWLIPYAKFRALKTYYQEVSFCKWPLEVIQKNIPEDVLSKIQDDVEMHCFIQYMFFREWHKLKTYAHQMGVSFIGDLPIYVSYDSSDVWQNPENFELDEALIPRRVAGCPPDAFSEDGQLWGNPLYNYEEMKKNNYEWWIKRLLHNLKLYDVLRIDHFRGFEAYFAIPSSDKNAKNGQWVKGPGYDIFAILKKYKPDAKMIMEDLGFLTPSVYQLLIQTGFPGMRVLEFAFDGRKNNAYLPHNYIENTVVYTGTHDNLPLKGWIETLSAGQLEQLFTYLNIENKGAIPGALVELAIGSIAKLAIIPLQDYLELGAESRINTPSTVGNNWKWRVTSDMFSSQLENKINKLTKTYFR